MGIRVPLRDLDLDRDFDFDRRRDMCVFFLSASYFIFPTTMKNSASQVAAFQQFHNLFIVRGSVQAIKCNFETGDVEFWLFGGGRDSLKTQVPPKDLEVALKAFSEGENFSVVAPAPEAPAIPAIPALQTTSYKLNEQVIAKDSNGYWYPGFITSINNDDATYRISFLGYSSRWDIVQPIQNIRPRLIPPLRPRDLVPGTRYLCNGHYASDLCDECIADGTASTRQVQAIL